MLPRRRNRLITRRTALAALFGGGALGCSHFSMLGYSTAPNYDPEIRSVYVPTFHTRFFETTPFRGAEFTLQRKVVDAIESKTPMKVISDPAGADTELQGTIVSITKVLTNRTPQNEAREVALYLTVEIVWHDLRPGHEGQILTNHHRRDLQARGFEQPFDPTVPPMPVKPDRPQPATLSTTGRAVPELGETLTTALHMAIDKMAIEIVSAMEMRWSLPKS